MDCAKIVVVEDDEDIRELVKEALELEGFTVVTCSNGKDALDKLSSTETPCLILLDLMMPVMDGEAFLEARRSMRDTIRAIPVYLVSAVADQKTAEATGADGYMRKPVDLDALIQLVKEHCPGAKTATVDSEESQSWVKTSAGYPAPSLYSNP